MESIPYLALALVGLMVPTLFVVICLPRGWHRIADRVTVFLWVLFAASLVWVWSDKQATVEAKKNKVRELISTAEVLCIARGGDDPEVERALDRTGDLIWEAGLDLETARRVSDGYQNYLELHGCGHVSRWSRRLHREWTRQPARRSHKKPEIRPSLIRVVSDPPGATVVMDGHPCGKTPVDVEVGAGRTNVYIYRDGYSDFQRFVEVAARKSVTIKVQLAPFPGKTAGVVLDGVED